MQVFKLYFKLLNKNRRNIIIYAVIFLGILAASTLNNKEQMGNVFYDTKADIAFINHDEDTQLVNGFKNYLKKSCNIIDDIGTSKDELQDALFFRRVVYVITVPKGFTKDFMAGKNPSLTKLTVPDSSNGTFVELAVNNYFNAARVYRNTIPALSQEKLVSYIQKNLDTKVHVTIQTHNGKQDYSIKVQFFNFYAYGIISVLVIGISLIMVSLRKLDLRRRNLVAPISNTSFNLQQIFGNVIYAFLAAVFLIFGGLHLVHDSNIDKVTLLFIFNAFIFTLCALSMAYLIGNVVNESRTVNAVSNVVALGLSFVSGVFVPKEMLGEIALNIGKFTPTYWYVTANEEIGKLTKFSWDNMSKIYQYMLIEIGFTVALILIALVISKKNSTKEC